jgi:mannosylglycerate hydrolase
MARFQATLVSHTHWDRAWYCTFQEFRVRLVQLVDKLLAILDADPQFRCFMLDGQMSVLEDYLEVRPSQAQALREYCRSGRIQVGPWFVLADEFLVSPEALIRNLRLGQRMGEDYGGVAKIGYVPDGFGHIAQLPQILRGFGIDNAFFWRGMGAAGDTLGSEFNWHAPDGSVVTAILMPWGYHNVTNLGYGIHWGDVSQMEFDVELALDKIERAINKLTPMANTDALLLMNGIDHAEAEARVPMIIQRANEHLSSAELRQGTLADHLAQVRASGKPLPDFSGEFRWGRYSEILQGVYSTRIHLKQDNHKGEVLLERYVEPLTAFSWLAGADVPPGVPDLVDRAWHWLLLNHPHDDIYGSGIDEVHHEMAFRFSQSRQIGEALVRDSLRRLSTQVDFSVQPGVPVIACNPLGWARDEIVDAEIDFEYDDPTADSFRVVNAVGEVVPHQVISDEQLFWMEVLKPNRKRRVHMLLPVQSPSCGYTSLYIQPSARNSPATDLVISERAAENGFLRLDIDADGGLTITDKATGKSYSGLGHLEDVADAGDEYTSCPVIGDQPFTTAGLLAEIIRTEAGPCRAAFRIRRTLRLPARLSDDRKQRSSEWVDMPVTMDVYVYAGQPAVCITTHIVNHAHDHKLMARFPSGIRAAQAHVDESFMVAVRDLALPDSTGWVEDPTPLMHQRTFTDLSNGEHGLAVLNRGLPSVEVYEDGTIALTLLRSVGWLSRDDLWVRRIAAGPLVPTPGAQCLGEYTYEYAIVPHAGDWRQVYQTAHNYNVPILARRADTHPGLELSEMNITHDNPALVRKRTWQRGGPLPATLSIVDVGANGLILTACYRSGDALIVRVYNPTAETVSGHIGCGVPLRHAEHVRMDETVLEALAVAEDGRIVVTVHPNEVYTLRLHPQPSDPPGAFGAMP